MIITTNSSRQQVQTEKKQTMKNIQYILIALLIASAYIEAGYSQCVTPNSFSTSACQGQLTTLVATNNYNPSNTVTGQKWYTTPGGSTYLPAGSPGTGVYVTNSP